MARTSSAELPGTTLLVSPGVLRPAQLGSSPKARTKVGDHPVIVRFPVDTAPAGRLEALRRFLVGGVAPEVVGVGSVGTEAFVLLLRRGPKECRDQRGPVGAGLSIQGSTSEACQATAEFPGAGAAQNDMDDQAPVDDVETGCVQAVTGHVTANPLPRLTGPLLRRALRCLAELRVARLDRQGQPPRTIPPQDRPTQAIPCQA